MAPRAHRRQDASRWHIYSSVFVALITACGTADDPESARTTLTATPLLTIDLESDAVSELGPVAGGVLLEDGGVALRTTEAPFLHRFSPDGSLLQSGGLEGSGPGELQVPRSIQRCGGDSLFVWTMARQRVVVFGPDLGFVREFALPGAAVFMNCNRAGEIVILSRPREPTSQATPDGDGGRARTRSWAYRSNTSGDSLPGVLDVPFAGSYVMSPFTWIAVTDSAAIIATADSLAITLYDMALAEGRDLVVGPWEPRPPTDAEHLAAVDEQLALVPSSIRTGMRESWLAGPRARSVPPYSAMVATPSGRVYLATSLAADSTTTVLVVEPGRFEPTVVTLPAGLRLMDASDDRLLLRTSWLAEHAEVIVYRVARGQEP